MWLAGETPHQPIMSDAAALNKSTLVDAGRAKPLLDLLVPSPEVWSHVTEGLIDLAAGTAGKLFL